MNRLQIAVFVVAVTASALAVKVAATAKVDTHHSTIGFDVPILNGLSHVTGKFGDFTADATYDPDNVENSTVKVTIKAESIDTGIDPRDKHLRSPVFFDVAKYPEITFMSKKVTKEGEKLSVMGDFTMHGVTKEVAIPFTITGTQKDPKGNSRVGFRGSFKLNRDDYGITWRMPGDPTLVGNEITVEISAVASY